MHWSVTLERDGTIIDNREGYMTDQDNSPAALMDRACMAHTGEKARVSTTVQRAIQYGEIKCSVTISVSVPQTGQWMDYAAKESFKMAVHYVNNGMGYLVPELTRL